MKNLTDIIYQYKDKDFSWTDFDCCIFSANVIEEYTGNKLTDWKSEILNYKDVKSSIKFLRKAGCKNLREAPTKVLGLEERDISTAKLGDIVYYINEDGQGIMGVCNGVRAYFLCKEGGITARKIDDCECCWSTN